LRCIIHPITGNLKVTVIISRKAALDTSGEIAGQCLNDYRGQGCHENAWRQRSSAACQITGGRYQGSKAGALLQVLNGQPFRLAACGAERVGEQAGSIVT
jgi:hypothetical protein